MTTTQVILNNEGPFHLKRKPSGDIRDLQCWEATTFKIWVKKGHMTPERKQEYVDILKNKNKRSDQ